MAHSMAKQYSTNKNWSLSKAKSSPSGQRRQYIDPSNGLCSNVMKTEWIKMLTLAGNTIIFQLRSQTKRSFMAADEDDKNMDLDVYLRLRIAWIFDLVELNFSLQQYPGAPSIRVSLRTQTRIKRLPLHGFLWIFTVEDHEEINCYKGKKPLLKRSNFIWPLSRENYYGKVFMLGTLLRIISMHKGKRCFM